MSVQDEDLDLDATLNQTLQNLGQLASEEQKQRQIQESMLSRYSHPKDVRINITPNKYAWFTDEPSIQFRVTLSPTHDMDRDTLNFIVSRLSAIAIPPSGSYLTDCLLISEQDPVSGLMCIQGSFIPPVETGIYTIQVNYECQPKNYATSETRVVISRNYIPNCLKLNEGWAPITLPSLSANRSKFWGLACDSVTGRIYCSEGADNRVICVEVDDKSNLRVIFQQRSIKIPAGICCDSLNRRLIVCDYGDRRVVFLSLDTGEYLGSLGSSGVGLRLFNKPWSVATDPDSTIIAVSDLGNHCVQTFDKRGYLLRQFPCQNPGDIGIRRVDNVLCIYVTSPFEGFVTELCSGLKLAKSLKTPQGLVVDECGGFLVTEEGNQCLKHYMPTIYTDKEGVEKDCHYKQLGEISAVAGYPLASPANVTILANGKVCLLLATGVLMIF